MKKITYLLIAVFTTAFFSANAQEKIRKARFQIEEQSSEELTLPELLKSPKAVLIDEANASGGLTLSSDFLYDSSGRLIEKSYYKFDQIGRQIEKATYILNDNSYGWMAGRENWICSYLLQRTYDPNDNRLTGAFTLSYEYKYLDYSTGQMIGSSKWNQTPSSISGFSTTYETYTWLTTINDWVRIYKYESTYTLNGNVLTEDEIFYEWNDTTETWVLLPYKYTYKYQKSGTSWYTIEIKEYASVNGSYIIDYEVVRDYNWAAKDYYSSVTKQLVDGQMVNSSKTIKSFNIYNRIKQSDTYSWYNNQWTQTTKDTYEYTTPDSIRTQTTYRTADYYTIYGETLPTLCTGQTMFPYQKRVLKTHAISNRTLVSYNYTWSNCGWIPSGIKSTYTYDATGANVLSQVYCPTNNGTDWTGCSLYSYNYNSKGKQVLYKSTTDGNLSNYKRETEYLSDTIVTKATDYYSSDLNGDGVITDTEWAFSTKRVYKYSLGTSSDSLHINTENSNSLEIYDLTTLKKLKVTGLISCEFLSELNNLSSDSLEVLDLSDAVLEGNVLKDSCMGYTYLRKLILPKTLKEIQRYAIESGDSEEDDEDYQKSLRELVIYPAIEKIESNAFYIMNLEKVTVPSRFFNKLYQFAAIPGINDVYKSTIKSVTFNDGSGKIQDAVCYNLPFLQKVTIEDGVTEIGNNAFKSCGMLQEVNFPATTLRKIGYNAFWGCNELKSLYLPDGLTAIDYSAFWGCSGLTSIHMPSSLTNIAQNAFWGCSTVSSMNVKSQTPPSLGNNALYGIPRSAILYVPETSMQAYKSTPQWKEFYNIRTNLDNAELSNIIISSENGQLSLQNLPEKSTISIYNMLGALVQSGINSTASESYKLNKGAYIVQIGQQYFKTIVK